MVSYSSLMALLLFNKPLFFCLLLARVIPVKQLVIFLSCYMLKAQHSQVKEAEVLHSLAILRDS